jgi:arsenate reductase-like glutaredoxin family protein
LSSLNDEETIVLIQENPSMMVRPVLMKDNRIITGFKEAEYQAFLSSAEFHPNY